MPMDEFAVGFCVLNHVNGYLFDSLSRQKMGTLLAFDALTVLALPTLNLSLYGSVIADSCLTLCSLHN